MTIHNIYLTAGFCLWLYILLCFCCKLLADKIQQYRNASRIRRIHLFFAAGHVDRSRVRSFQKILAYAKEDTLFNCICDRYAEMAPQYDPNEKAILDLYMRKLLHMRIHLWDGRDPLVRCTLINNIYLCRITSDEIRLFLLECGECTQLEQYCIDLQKACWQLKVAR